MVVVAEDGEDALEQWMCSISADNDSGPSHLHRFTEAFAVCYPGFSLVYFVIFSYYLF